MATQSIFYIIVSILSLAYSLHARNQSEFFYLMKTSLSGDGLNNWDVYGGNMSFCNFTGVVCDDQGFVQVLDINGWYVSGRFPVNVCSYFPRLRVLNLGNNNLHGDFLHSVVNCSLLEELNLASLHLTTTLPDFSPLKNLRILDMSRNRFRGNYPMSVTNLTNLELLNFNENQELNNISRLTKLKSMLLGSSTLTGPISVVIGNMTSFSDLQLNDNFLTGEIPSEIGLLKNLRQLQLSFNYVLSGNIPEELGNLTELVEMDISANKLSGKIPDSICQIPKLEVLQLHYNNLTGQIPSCIANSRTLRKLLVGGNSLTGQVPQKLGEMSVMIVLDLSGNRLMGTIPAEVCNGGKLQDFLLLNNMFSGELPHSYAKCNSLIHFQVGYNLLEGSIPEGLVGLPRVKIIDLSYNYFNGSIPNTIGRAKNLSEMLFQGNKISGFLPPEISGAVNLERIDISSNLLSGPLPLQIGYLKKLKALVLQGNMLNSSIPDSLSFLKSLQFLDLSRNLLTGNVPESLSALLTNSMHFQNNNLSGPIPVSLIRGGWLYSFAENPGLCVPVHVPSNKEFPSCSKKFKFIWVIVVSIVTITVGALLYILKLKLSKRQGVHHDEDMLYDVKSFHGISFDQQPILEGITDTNIIGHGGFGTVYRVELSSNEVVAVKKLLCKIRRPSASMNSSHLGKESASEVDTLGLIRHMNIIKLYAIFFSPRNSLLVYEYMPNGNLWDALHTQDANINLSWPIRRRIALGVAQGLAYLHHGLTQTIIHRDIKSTNILLDHEFRPKVADFGLAKLLESRNKNSTSTVIAGTFGYLAPEYAYTCRATTKCDVYGFGVVLMELVTGRKPVEEFYGEGRNIINWVVTKMESSEEIMEALDERVVTGSFKDEMIFILLIATLCTRDSAVLRPTMNQVLQLLMNAEASSNM